MRKLSIWMIGSSWLLYVLVPILYRTVYGAYPENIQSLGYVPESYMTKAAVLITAVFLISAFIIQIWPVRAEWNEIGTISARTSYFYITLLVFFLLAYRAGALDYKSVLLGGTSGALISYYSMFFYPQVLFVIFLYCGGSRRNIWLLSGVYLLITLLSSSRAGAVHVGIFLLGLALASSNNSSLKIKAKATEFSRKYQKQIRLLVILMVIIAPVVYIRSTAARGSTTSTASHRAIETIAARCSCLDEAGLALYLKDTGGSQMGIFQEKYSFFHQLGCIIDSTLPGSLFGGDVDPNQYYRAMVGYMSVSDAAKYYSSVNLMLPTYLVMKYGWTVGSLMAVIAIVGFYVLVSNLKKPAWKVVLIAVVFSEMLYYFDWVMIWKSFLRGALTVITLEVLTGKVHVMMPRIRLPRLRFCFDTSFFPDNEKTDDNIQN